MAKVRWKEPASFKRALARQESGRPNHWYPLLLAVGITVVGLGATVYHNNPVGESWPLTVAATAGVGMLLAYGVPFLASRDPNLVVISERGVGWRVMHGGVISLECWTWERIAYCSMASMTLEGQAYPVLVLHSGDEEQAFFALSPDVEAGAITAAIRDNGGEFRLEGQRHAEPGDAADGGDM